MAEKVGLLLMVNGNSKDMNFEAFVEDIRSKELNVHGVLVHKEGELLYSYGDTTNTRYPIYSATKTILSLAVGMAYDEGKINLEQSIVTNLPSDILSELSEEQIIMYQDITVERLLTMSVKGFPFRPEGESYLRYSLSCNLEKPQEKIFDYSNISAYLVGVALTNALQEDVYHYLDRKLFKPLHIIDPIYKSGPEGYFYGASGMELTVDELSRIGLLLYNEGVFDGERIISQKYIRKATCIQLMNREGGYGYFIWKYQDGFSINGKWGQKCYVLPKSDLVITYLSDMQENSHLVKRSMEENLLHLNC